jgi:Carboxypeptidase regulatory-like domain
MRKINITAPFHTRLAFVAAIALAVPLHTPAQILQAPEPQPATLMGTVMDGGGDVVPNASIVLQGPAPDDTRHAVALDNGFFRIADVKPGIPYHIFVNAEGFASWTSSEIILEPGQSFIVTGITLRIATLQTTVTAVQPEELAVQQVKVEEKQRVLGGIIPNFYAIYDPNAVPLSSRLKFELAFKALTDPATIAGFGFNAAIYQMSGYPGYREGTKGYAERLGATFAGGYTNILVGDAILPSLLHQDPRYFYQGTGTTKSRLLHALSAPFITRGDNGCRQINYSQIGGDLASGAIANAYYPSKDRGGWRVISSALIGTGGRMAESVLQEFVFHKHSSGKTLSNSD